MEAKILEALNWDLSFISPYDFLKRLCFIEEDTDDIYCYACFLLDYLLHNRKVNTFHPSELAIACYFSTY